LLPEDVGIWDNVRVKKQLLHLGYDTSFVCCAVVSIILHVRSLVAMKLLLVDEIIRAGRKFNKAPADPNAPVM